MLNLLRKSIEEYDVDKAVVIGRNIVNKDPNNREAVQCYLDFLFELSDTLPVIEERKDYLEQGKMIIAFVEENATLNPAFLEWIMAYSEKALTIEKRINKDEADKVNRIVSDIEISNNKALIEIHELCGELKQVGTQEEFDDLMKKFIEIDRGIEKAYLTTNDQLQYDELSKLCSETISSKMQELERKQSIEYNEKAVQSYHDAFIEFSSYEARYKDNINKLITMLKTKLFCFESEKLFPETLVYYQYVYSRIFDKLSDDGKMKITYASIKANK